LGYQNEGYELPAVLLVLEYILVLMAMIFNEKLKKWLIIS
jgi:hypothetical protein